MKLQADEQFIKIYSDIIAKLLPEKMQGQKSLKKIYTVWIETKNLCTWVKNQEYYKFARLP